MRKELYPERVEIRLTKDQFKKLALIAIKKNLTMSQLIRNIIDSELD